MPGPAFIRRLDLNEGQSKFLEFVSTQFCTILVGIASCLVVAGQVSAAEESAIEYSCGVTGRDAPTTPDGRIPLVLVLQLKKADPVQLPSGTDPAKHAVSCARSLLVPSVNDVKVLDLGLDLFIGASDKNPDKPRAGLLTGSKPNIVFLVIEGAQSKSEAEITRVVLKEINRQ